MAREVSLRAGQIAPFECLRELPLKIPVPLKRQKHGVCMELPQEGPIVKTKLPGSSLYP